MTRAGPMLWRSSIIWLRKEFVGSGTRKQVFNALRAGVGRSLALPPVAAGILPAVDPGVPPGGLVGTQAETTSARPRWALLRHDRAAGGTPAATSHLARQSGAVSRCARWCGDNPSIVVMLTLLRPGWARCGGWATKAL